MLNAQALDNLSTHSNVLDAQRIAQHARRNLLVENVWQITILFQALVIYVLRTEVSKKAWLMDQDMHLL